MAMFWLHSPHAGKLAAGLLLGVLVVRLGPAEPFDWTRVCCGDGVLDEPAVVLAPGGDAALALTFRGSVDCGAGEVAAAGGTDDIDGLLVKLDAGGNVAWTRQIGSLGVQLATAVAIDPWGSVIVAGSFEGTIELGGHSLTARSEHDVLLAKFDADGALLWTRRFGLTGRSFGVDVAAAPSGRILLLAMASSDIDFGGGALPASGSSHFVAAFGLNGDHLGSARLGAAGDGPTDFDLVAARPGH